MNIIDSLKTTLKEQYKTLSERHSHHLETTIKYLEDLPKDFASAKKAYHEAMSKFKEH